jgi:F0F1-type ATP synthase assembly protein I
MPAEGPKPSGLAYVMALSQVGLEMVVPIGLGVGLDLWIGTVPWFMILGVVLGLVGGLVHMMAILRRMDRSKLTKPP